LILAGCGLTLDLEPPDPLGQGDDAGVGPVDLSSVDLATPADGSTPVDSGPTDLGTPVACESDDDCAAADCLVAQCVAGSCAGTPVADGTECDAGSCRAGACVPTSCGNGILDAGEVCDDGNSIRLDGCELDCTPSCSADSDCDNGVLCDGTESCTPAESGGSFCQPSASPPLPSDDLELCGICDETTGEFEVEYQDDDADGYPRWSLHSCAVIDCDDRNAAVHPGARERPDDLVDSDCDGDDDTTAPPLEACYVDGDGDGFGDDDTGVPLEEDALVCPALLVPDGGDCNDADDSVNPGHGGYSGAPHCDAMMNCSFDWNCDGREERKYLDRASCLFSRRDECEASEGWYQRRIPDCGEIARWATCHWTILGCLPEVAEEPRTQTCR
tara:strand:+ start:803 stop:1963 length:1161 start_codon:yes stop_codon:yes gene_type:complete